MTQNAKSHFVGCLGSSEEFSPNAAGFACTQIGSGQGLWLKGDGVSSYKWDGGFVLVSGRGFQISGSTGKELCAETVARKYQESGEDSAGAFDGSFVVVLWDAVQQKLLLWRDNAGARLLYYYQSADNNLWFATSLQLLMHHVGRRPVSRHGLTEYLRFLDISPPYTIYEDVVFLPPEKLVRAGCGKKAESIDKPAPPILRFSQPENFDAAVTILDELLKQSILRQVQPNSKLCAFLSGGIDSSLVCAVAAAMRGDMKAVTVGFDDVRFDESPVAHRVAKHLGIKHEVMCFSQEDDVRAFEKFTSAIGSPFADPAIIPTFQCFEKTADLCDLVLDGTGADTLIGMMPARHIRFILAYSSRLPDTWRKMFARACVVTERTGRYKDLFDFDDPVELLIRWKGWTKAEISTLCGQTCDLSHTLFYGIYREGFAKQSPYELYSLLMGNLPDDRIHQSREIFGPEVVFPFFDHTIQSFVRSLPLTYRYAPDKPKKLFRHLLGRYVPQEIWDVPKHGFDYPFENLMTYHDNYLIKTYLSPESLAQHGLLDPEIVTKYVHDFLAGDLSLRFKIWALVVFQAWYDNFYRLQGDGLSR